DIGAWPSVSRTAHEGKENGLAGPAQETEGILVGVAGMPRFSLRRRLLAALFAGAAMLERAAVPEALANPAPGVTRGPSGLPLPRFVSLKSSRVNMRVGPGVNYAVDWMYLKSGLPMEIIQEYDNWRKVRDADGAEGWINQALLSGRRTGIAAPWFKGKEAALSLLSEPQESSQAVAK